MTTKDPRTGSAAPGGDAQKSFDVFLSYSRRDRDAVIRIALFLKRKGFEPWLDSWYVTPGRSWQHEIAAGLAASRTCAVFIGAGDLGPWEREEVELAMDHTVGSPAFRVFPVLLPGVDPLAQGTLPPFLRTRMWVDMRDGPGESRGLDQLVHAVLGLPIGPDVPLEPCEDVAPYRGLLVFEERDAPFFFGRDRDVQRLVERLRNSRFVAVLGASGSGKSSLARAGLVPALRAGRLPGGESWPIAVVRPGGHPLEAIATALAGVGDDRGLEVTLADLERGERGAHLAAQYALTDRAPAERAVIVVDQLEEAFTQCEDEHERSTAFDNLVYAATRPGGRSVVVVTMRADFYAHLARHRTLAALVEGNHELVGPLGDDELRQVIEAPARRAGLTIEDGLAATMIADAGRDPGALPLLEHALLETWTRRRAGMLTLEGYRASGGVAGALAQRAEAVYEGLAPDRREVARRLLLRLTHPGEGVADTRRRAPRAELLAAEADRGAVEAVIDRFTEERLLTAAGDESKTPCVEVAHEALIRGWPRLQAWIDESRIALVVGRRLTEAAGDWERLGHDPSALYAGARLAEARGATAGGDLGLTDVERDFLAASEHRERRERGARRLRRVVVGGSVALGLLVAGMVARPEVERYLLREQAIDASPQVAIAGGIARLGGSGGRPSVEVRLVPFSIDRYEVTNREYRRCVRADGCSEPVTPSGMPTYLEAGEDMPVLGVTAAQAAAFCRFLGRRLPTDAEWERAARGPDGTTWPWGNEPPTGRRANLDFGGDSSLAAVDDPRYGAGNSAEGAAQMVGNAAEWTSTPSSCARYRCRTWDGRTRVPALWSRGRGWRSGAAAASGEDAIEVDSGRPDQDQGFRCAADRN